MADHADKIELRLIKTLWGIDEPISPYLLESIKDEGYHGIEVIRLAWSLDRDLLVNSLNKAGLGVVCQVHTTGGYLDNTSGEYVYCGAYDVTSHKKDFQQQLRECYELLNLVNSGGFINVHAGVDAWSNEEAVNFLTFCLDEMPQSAPGITVTFETHRQRLFGSPFQTRDLLFSSSSSSSLSKLKLNADLSHWYCACERVFNSNDERDKWWPGLVSSFADHCEYIHARFGWAQGPQLADPSAAECSTDRVLQIEVWKTLMTKQIHRILAGSKNHTIYVSPEYGPAPYMAVKPHSQEPVASLPDAVAYTKKVLEALFRSIC